jgi:hypothetical protein
MHPTLAHAIDTLCQERDAEAYSQTFTAVNLLVNEFGEDQLATRLFDAIPRTVAFELVAELFGVLIWSTRDNGGAIMRTLESWLEDGADDRKIRIALAIDYLQVYPFNDDERMRTVLLTLAQARHRHAGQCERLIAARRALTRPTSRWAWLFGR